MTEVAIVDRMPTVPAEGATIISIIERATRELLQEVARTYKRLLESQEPLGAAFEKIWDANVEKLYEA